MKQPNKTLQLLPVLFGFFIMGFCDIVGITSDYVQRTFHWSPLLTGFVPSMVFIWFLFLSIPVGNRMGRWGRKRTVLLSMVITILGMILPLTTYTGVTCMIAFALLGIGNVILQVSLNPLLNNVITDPKYLTSSLTSGQVIKAVSSLVGPEIVLLAVALYGEEYWYYCFPILGGITLIAAIWLYATAIPTAPNEQATEQIALSDTLGLLRNKTILLLVGGIFFVVGVDVATNFISSKLMAIRFDWAASQVKYAPQVYFFSRTVGALIGAVALMRLSATRYFQVNIVGGIAAVIVLMTVHNATIDMLCIGAIGFFMSSVFSIIYSLALQVMPEKTNQLSGLMMTAIAGGAIVTPVLGLSIAYFGLVGGLAVILCCILYLTACAFGVSVPKQQPTSN